MFQSPPTRVAAALLLAFCLAGGGRAGAGGGPEQGFGNSQHRHHSASAAAGRVAHTRSGQISGALEYSLNPGIPAAITVPTATGRVLAPGVLIPRSSPVARSSGRSPPRFE